MAESLFAKADEAAQAPCALRAEVYRIIRKQNDKGQQIVKKFRAIVLTKSMDGVKYKTSKSQERSSKDDEEVLLLLLLFYQGLPAFCEC